MYLSSLSLTVFKIDWMPFCDNALVNLPFKRSDSLCTHQHDIPGGGGKDPGDSDVSS